MVYQLQDKKSGVWTALVLFTVLVSTAPAEAVTASAATSKLADPVAQERPSLDPWVPARIEELLARRPSFTAIRLDPSGAPQTRIDLRFGSSLPESREIVRELCEQFVFEDEVDQSGEEQRDLPEWRTVILSSAPSANQEVKATCFVPDEDVLFAFYDLRSAEQVDAAPVCSSAWTVLFHGSDPVGTTRFFQYFYASGMVAATQARRGSDANPDLLLWRWIGGQWVLRAHASKTSWMDGVRGTNYDCASTAWLVGVYMTVGGEYSCLAAKFDAH